jgi:hypothetical protein
MRAGGPLTQTSVWAIWRLEAPSATSVSTPVPGESASRPAHVGGVRSRATPGSKCICPGAQLGWRGRPGHLDPPFLDPIGQAAATR